MHQVKLAAAVGIVLSSLLTQISAAADANQYLLGDWNHTRTRLEEAGVTFNFAYVSEIAHNASGGSEHLTRYSDQWLLGTELDLQKLWGWNGTKLNIAITDRNGNSLSTDADLGTLQLVQENYGRGQTWRLTSLFFAQSLLDERLNLKAGRMSVGSDFAAFNCEFQNLTLCGAQPGHLAGRYWGNRPVSVWAGVGKFNTTKETYAQLGVYQVNPHYVDDSYNVHKGLYPNFPQGTTGALIPLEFGFTPAHVELFNGLPGSFRVGVWYNTSDSDDLRTDTHHEPLGTTSAGALQHDGAYGGYINVQQQITGSAGGSGATVFFNAAQADKFTAATDGQMAVGVQYKGAFDRPADVIGVALGATHSNGRRADAQRVANALHPNAATVVNDGYETVGEVYYAWSPLRLIVLRPNVQYVVHPGGTGQNADALVIGLKTSISF
jgi:porin